MIQRAIDMESSDLLKDYANHQLGTILRNQFNNDYSAVHVLSLYWQDADNSGYEREAKALSVFFREKLQYSADTFPIPSRGSQLEVESKISSFLLKDDDILTLHIIHYGGHGDPNDDLSEGEERQSVWSACDSDSPTVDWFDIQPKLKNSQGDVLVLLDCCHGAQAGRGMVKPPIKVELLAACPMGSLTPSPGPRSFTTALIAVMHKTLDEDGFIFLDQLHASLAARDKKLFASPFYCKLGVGGRRSIRLEPLLVGPTLSTLDRESVVHLSLLARGQLSMKDLDGMAQWLNNDTPRFISAVEVQNIILTTERLQSLLAPSTEDGKAVLDVLEKDSKADVLKAWDNIMGLIASYEPLWGGSSHGGWSDNLSILEERAGAFLKQLQLRNTSLEREFERGLLESTNLNQRKILDATLSNDSVKTLGFSEMLGLRRIIKFPLTITEPLELSYLESESFHGKSEVLHEYKWYQEELSASEISALRKRVMLLAELLHVSKSSEFSSLKCIHWFHNPQRQHFGLIFEIPEKYLSPLSSKWINLVEAIKTATPRPTLGERFRMALSIAQAVAKWHSVGWVHQSIASHDILFFYDPSEGKFDYSTPYLAGFEFSRPVADRSLGRYVERKYISRDIYRHPDRLGASQKSHVKEHDIYSLGVVLLEIGLWQVAVEVIASAQRAELTPAAMMSQLKRTVTQRIAHYAGRGYERAVSSCFESDLGVNIDNREQTQLGVQFQIRIVDQLKLCASLE